MWPLPWSKSMRELLWADWACFSFFWALSTQFLDKMSFNSLISFIKSMPKACTLLILARLSIDRQESCFSCTCAYDQLRISEIHHRSVFRFASFLPFR